MVERTIVAIGFRLLRGMSYRVALRYKLKLLVCMRAVRVCVRVRVPVVPKNLFLPKPKVV